MWCKYKKSWNCFQKLPIILLCSWSRGGRRKLMAGLLWSSFRGPAAWALSACCHWIPFQPFHILMVTLAWGCGANLLAVWTVLCLTQWAQSLSLSQTYLSFPLHASISVSSVFSLNSSPRVFLLVFFPPVLSSHLFPFPSLKMHYSSSRMLN